MAVTTQKTPFSQGELDALDKQKSALETSLRQSPTYYSNVTPTDSDLALQARIRQANDARQQLINKRLAEQWYPNSEQSADEASSKTKPKQGLVGTILDRLSRPLYATVGAVEHVTGKGTEGSLLENMNKNMMERKETFGNLLQKSGVSHGFAAPLGFALDIAFDPVNWLTAGVGAAIPRAGYGLVQGLRMGKGLEGLTKAVTSSALQKTATVGKFIPYVNKSERLEKIGKAAAQSWEDYNKVVGRDFVGSIEKRGKWFGTGEDKVTLGDFAHNAILRFVPGGDTFIKQFEYNPAHAQKLANMVDDVEDMQVKGGTKVEPIVTYEGDVFGAQSKTTSRAMAKASDVKNVNTAPVGYSQQNIMDITREGEQLMKEKPHLLTSFDNDVRTSFNEGNIIDDELTKRSVQETVKGIDEGNKVISRREKTGVQAYDSLIDKVDGWGKDAFGIKDINLGKKILDTFGIYDTSFKAMKIAMNPASYINALVGNIAMYGMYGGEVFDPKWIKSVTKSYASLHGWTKDDMMTQLLFNPLWQDYFSTRSKVFKDTIGIDPSAMQVKRFTDKMVDDVLGDEKAMEIIKSLGGRDKTKEETLKMIEALKKESLNKAKYTVATELGLDNVDDVGNTMAANELNNVAYNHFKDLVKSRANSGDPLAKAFNWMLTKPMKEYERFDQAYKMGTASLLTLDGVPESVLTKMSRMVSIKAEDIVSKYDDFGTPRYRLTPEKAMQIVNEVYLNYSAMPGAIKVLRSLPVLGSPFLSFAYGMAHNTGKALVYNPAFFNKVNFAMKEISGQKTPLERKGLESEYYKWFSQDGMMKLPFFKENPVYINVANMLPYLTMNMFMPSNRKYEETLPAEIVSMIDKSPLFKHPMGQLLFDYIVQPLLIRDANPQGSFGQPLYPKDATTIDKAGYAARSFGESLTPGVVGYIGPLVPSSMLDYFPSYHGRGLGYAWEGKSGVGIETKTPATQKVIQRLGAMSGLPTYEMDLTNLNNKDQ